MSFDFYHTVSNLYGLYNIVNILENCFLFCSENETRTHTDITVQGILSPSCLPIPPSRHLFKTLNVKYVKELVFIVIFYKGTAFILKKQVFL